MSAVTEKQSYANRHLDVHLIECGVPVSDRLVEMIRAADFGSAADRAALRAEIEKSPEGTQYLRASNLNSLQVCDELAERMAAVVLQNVTGEFKDFLLLHPGLGDMEDLTWAILKQKLTDAGCEVKQTRNTHTRWSARKVE